MEARWSFVVEPLIRAYDAERVIVSDPPGPLSARLRAREGIATGRRLAVVDGDPNWYSVRRRLEAHAAARGEHLILVDDVGWPYAHRDGYAAPAAVPLAHRNACRRQGILPHQEQLAGSGGLHPDRLNGVFTHGSANGVAAALADFVRAHPGFALAVVGGFEPLGIVAGPGAPAGLLGELLADPNPVLARRGFFAAAAEARLAAARPLLTRAQERMRAARPYAPEPVSPLAPPHPSGDALRDGLRAALTGHPLLAQLMRSVDAVLQDARIPYAVVEGTLLGAVRHGGLIPHDDDLDITVHRDDLPRLTAALQAAGWVVGRGSLWAGLGHIHFICPDDPLITDAGLWHRPPVIDIFPITASTRSPILSVGELAACDRRPFGDFSVPVPRAASAIIERQFGARALAEVAVWRRDGAGPPPVCSLDEYNRICAEEGYRPPRTLAPAA